MAVYEGRPARKTRESEAFTNGPGEKVFLGYKWA